jgi:hypothetical protein
MSSGYSPSSHNEGPCLFSGLSRDISGAQSGIEIRFSPSPSVFPCLYNFIAAPYLLLYHLGEGHCVS